MTEFDENADATKNPWRRFIKPAIALYVITFAGIVAAYILVATMDIQVSAYITGPKVFEIGRENAIRGFVLDAPTGRMYRDAETTFRLRKGADEVGVVASEATAGHGYVHTTLGIDSEPGEYALDVTIEHPAFDEPYQASAPAIQVSGARPFRWPSFTSRLPEEKKGWQKNLNDEWTGDLRIDALPLDGELVRGLENTVWLRLTEKVTGEPVQGTITFEKLEGISEIPLKKTYRTDAMGLVRIPVKPVSSHRWTLSARTNFGDDEFVKMGSGTVAFATVPAQFSLQMRESFVTPGDYANGMIYTLYRSGGFMVDLYDPNHWVAADAFGITPQGGGLKIQAPATENPPDFYRVQVYESVFQPGNAWDVKYVARVDSQDSQGCRDALNRVLDLLEKHDPDHWRGYALSVRTEKVIGPTTSMPQCNAWLDALLLAIPRHFDAPEILVNSQQDDRAELEAWKEKVKGRLLVAIIFALAIGLLNVLVFVLSAAAESTRRQALMNAELADLDEIPVVDTRLDRAAHIMRVTIIIGTLIFFAIGIVLILSLL